MNRIILPENLVQYVAQDLLRRAQVIQLDQPTVHEISPAPLPREVLRIQNPRLLNGMYNTAQTLLIKPTG